MHYFGSKDIQVDQGYQKLDKPTRCDKSGHLHKLALVQLKNKVTIKSAHAKAKKRFRNNHRQSQRLLLMMTKIYHI